MDIEKRLDGLCDKAYADFQARLVPNIAKETVMGVRVPELRKLAKELVKSGEYKLFFAELPHRYYDENMLHGIMVSELKDYDLCIDSLEEFLPFVDNWAVCDVLSPKIFAKHKDKLSEKIKEWTASDRTYTVRFGMGMILKHFLDEDFKEEYLDIAANIRSEEYYVNMMIAWLFAEALAKKWEFAIGYLEENRLGKWVHNKAISKARESYRISADKKESLNRIKRIDS